MAIKRKDALKRLLGLAPQVEAHVAKLSFQGEQSAAAHWAGEAVGWLRQMRNVLPSLGKKTAAEWLARIEEWEAVVIPASFGQLDPGARVDDE